MELVHSAQHDACQEILRQYEPNVGGHHLAGTLHLADDLPTGIKDTTVPCPGRLSLSLFVPQGKRAPKTSKHDKEQTFTFAPSLSISRMV
jgi:hypothetical protein